MRSEDRNTLVLFILLAAIAVFLPLVSGCKEGGREKSQSKAVPNVIIQNGETVLTLNKSAQEKSGIIAAPLKAVLHQKEIRAYGTVMQPDALIDIRNSYLSAKASADKADAALDASRKEYERLKKLNEDNRNISDKALQAASAVLASNEADVSASREKLQAVQQTAVAQWGGVIAEWIFRPSPEFERLTELKEVLIRITLPPDKFIETAPALISIQAQGPKLVSARFVSRSPVADPRTQGIGFLYAALSHPSLIPGVNVRAVMPFGPNIKGVVIPLSAVVWLQGRAWAYVKETETGFSRVEVPTSEPMHEGYFVTDVFSPGMPIVVRGAQALLSKESLPSGGGGEEED